MEIEDGVSEDSSFDNSGMELSLGEQNI